MADEWVSSAPSSLDAIHTDFGFQSLTPIQASLIPLAIDKHKDLLVEAVTGSGKTLSYVVPVLERLIRREAELAAQRGGNEHDGGSDHRGLRKNEVFAIVVVPTRELAIQVHAVFERFFHALHRQMAVETEASASSVGDVVGEEPATHTETYYPSPLLLTSGQGGSTSSSTHALFPPAAPIIVATPGRLARYLNSTLSSSTPSTSAWSRSRKHVSFASFEVLVLDEADSLLGSKDHLKDMMEIWKCLPRQRRNWLFSATMMDLLAERDLGAAAAGGAKQAAAPTAGSKGLTGLEMAGLRNLTRVVVRVEAKRKRAQEDDGSNGANGGVVAAPARKEERRTPLSLQNTYLICPQSEKTLQLLRVIESEIQHHDRSKFIVYFSTCAAVDYFYRVLRQLPRLAHVLLCSLHGHLPASARASTMTKFTQHASMPSSPAILLCTDVAARGLDLPDVDGVVQYDPPTDPKVFSHRAGRTARMGKAGKGVVLLTPEEEPYVEFLSLRKIPLRRQARLRADLEEMDRATIDPEAFSLRDALRAVVLTDRDLADRAAKSFVSAIRAYTKHEASYIFRLPDLDVFGMATSFGLLRLPKMPEIKAWRERRAKHAARLAKGGESLPPGDDIDWQDAEVDWNTYAYASKARESQRQAELATAVTNADQIRADKELKAQERQAQKERQSAWSVQKERKEKRDVRREKNEKRKDKLHAEERLVRPVKKGMVEAFLERAKQTPGQTSDDSDDDEDMDGEYKAMKKEGKTQEATGGGNIFDDLS